MNTTSLPPPPPTLPRAPVHVNPAEYFGAVIVALLASGVAALIVGALTMSGAVTCVAAVLVGGAAYPGLVWQIRSTARSGPAAYPSLYWSSDGKLWWSGLEWRRRDDPELARATGRDGGSTGTSPSGDVYLSPDGAHWWDGTAWRERAQGWEIRPNQAHSRRAGLVVAVVFGWLITIESVASLFDPGERGRSVGGVVATGLVVAGLTVWGTIVLVVRGRGPRVHQLLWPAVHPTTCSNCGGSLGAVGSPCAYCGHLTEEPPVDIGTGRR